MKSELESFKQETTKAIVEHDEREHDLDAIWIAVTIDRDFWRVAKELGCKKDGYWGWMLTSTSVNGGGTELKKREL